MAVIPLNRGMYSIVDNGFQDYLMKWLWTAKKQRNYWYAVRNRQDYEPDGKKTIYLHQEIMRLSSTDVPEGYVIDHINHNALDNRLCNLRVVTVAQNAMNASRRASGSGYIGVRWDDRAALWKAYLTIEGREKFVAYSASKKTAAVLRDRAAIKIYDNATLNFPNLRDEYDISYLDVPEYVLTEEDKKLIYNFVRKKRVKPA